MLCPPLKLAPLMVLALVSAACGSGEPDDAPETVPAADSAQMTAQSDEAAIDALRQDWVTHYNLHHADMVAEFYSDSAWILNADQSVDQGRAAVEASLAEAMAANPTATVSSGEVMVFGDHAVTTGRYEVEVAPEGGEAMSWAGHYMNYLVKVDGQWRIEGMITNYDSPRPEGWAWVESDDEMPPEEGTLTELAEGYETHWNLQHPDMVADFYAPDAVAAFASRPPAQGRAAVGQVLAESAAEMATNIDIYDVGTVDLADGWKLDAGGFEITAAEGGETVQTGMYMNLVQQVDDGSWKIRWMVSNGRPGGG